MDQLRFVEFAPKLRHEHHDGTWGVMEPMESRREHRTADHDPERHLPHARVYKCSRCDETMMIMPGEEGQPPPEPERVIG